MELRQRIKQAKLDFLAADSTAVTHYLEVELPADDFEAYANDVSKRHGKAQKDAAENEQRHLYCYGMPVRKGTKFEVRKCTPDWGLRS